jgi:hypothetical protein
MRQAVWACGQRHLTPAQWGDGFEGEHEAMNINNLEKLVRSALSGGNTADKSSNMLNSGLISPIEHKSLQSLSFQIAANLNAEQNAGTMTFVRPIPNLIWV